MFHFCKDTNRTLIGRAAVTYSSDVGVVYVHNIVQVCASSFTQHPELTDHKRERRRLRRTIIQHAIFSSCVSFLCCLGGVRGCDDFIVAPLWPFTLALTSEGICVNTAALLTLKPVAPLNPSPLPSPLLMHMYILTNKQRPLKLHQWLKGNRICLKLRCHMSHCDIASANVFTYCLYWYCGRAEPTTNCTEPGGLGNCHSDVRL